jgi:NADH:ubiquinone oxidoreductase subunit 2 (subunit N)
VIVAMYMQDGQEDELASPASSSRMVVALAAVITVALGLLPAPLLELAANAIPL